MPRRGVRSVDRDYFLDLASGFAEGLEAAIAYDFTFSNSVWNPEAKSWVPYSKSTTKQNVKNTKRTNQKRPRIKAMVWMVPYSPAEVNEAPNFRFERPGETAILFQQCAYLYSI